MACYFHFEEEFVANVTDCITPTGQGLLTKNNNNTEETFKFFARKFEIKKKLIFRIISRKCKKSSILMLSGIQSFKMYDKKDPKRS
jgi:hypothetical protein